MTATAIPADLDAETPFPSANDRFHETYAVIFWISLILAVAIHFMVLNYWPSMVAEDVSFTAEELTAIELPPEIAIPEAPVAIARPATPVIATGDINEDVTIALTTFESNLVRDLPPPPTIEESAAHDLSVAPVFTPYTVRPELKNRDEVRRALEKEYPPLLRDAGIGGAVQVWFFIDEEGVVVRTQVAESSGHRALDEAALAVASIAEFTPALNRDQRVPVWISLPITFTTR